MARQTGTRDPRTLITPDAFQVDEALLGMPLASPSRRLVALLIDLSVIGILTVVTRSFALVLGVVAAAFVLRAGFKRTPVKGSVFGRAMRLSVGCLGIFIGLITAVIWLSVGSDGFGDGEVTSRIEGVEVTGQAGQAFGALGGGLALAMADDLDEATEAFRALATSMAANGASRRDVREAGLELLPSDADWRDEAPAAFDAILAELFEEEPADEPGEVDPVLADAMVRVSELSTREVLLAYADALDELAALDPDAAAPDAATPGEVAQARAAAGDPAVTAFRQALELRLLQELAADTLDALTDEVEDLDTRSQELRRDLAQARDRIRESEEGGFFNWIRTVVDELGFGFGWASLYLTVMLSWWKGQSIGKKMMGVRVVRLDGEPITWWIAFERAGGYAAGFATGLLGFAQIYWDANRQAIHDRIVGTVVVREGAARIEEWEEAL
jgi:hypothetical protein